MRSVEHSATSCLGSSPTFVTNSRYISIIRPTRPLLERRVGNSSRAATAILALFFLCEPTRLGRRPSAYHAAYEEAPSGQNHSHGMLPYWKATDEDGSSVIHGSLHLGGMEKERSLWRSDQRISAYTALNSRA